MQQMKSNIIESFKEIDLKDSSGRASDIDIEEILSGTFSEKSNTGRGSLVEAVMTLPKQSQETEMSRRNTTVEAVIEHCRMERGGTPLNRRPLHLYPPCHRGLSNGMRRSITLLQPAIFYRWPSPDYTRCNVGLPGSNY